eukprot:197937_1
MYGDIGSVFDLTGEADNPSSPPLPTEAHGGILSSPEAPTNPTANPIEIQNKPTTNSNANPNPIINPTALPNPTINPTVNQPGTLRPRNMFRSKRRHSAPPVISYGQTLHPQTSTRSNAFAEDRPSLLRTHRLM